MDPYIQFSSNKFHFCLVKDKVHILKLCHEHNNLKKNVMHIRLGPLESKNYYPYKFKISTYTLNCPVDTKIVLETVQTRKHSLSADLHESS